MKQGSLPPLTLCALAIKWRAIGLILLGLARAASRLDKTGGRGGWPLARMLQSLAHVALHEMSAELFESYAAHPAENETEADTLAYLLQIRAALMALALFARKLMLQLAGRCPPGFAMGGQYARLVCRAGTAPIYALPFLDSG